jgi:tRNA-dihydrouridine synthase
MNLKIGNLLIKNNVVVGPMAGISDPVFFELIAKFKPGLIFSEMISAVALKHHSKKTNDMLKYKKCKIPLAIQIFGSKTIDLVSAAIYIYNTYHPAMIDINMGCPVHKVAVKSSAGASLLQDPKKVAEIIKAIKKELPTCPLSIKIRSG